MTQNTPGANPSAYTSPIIFSAPMIRALLDGRKTQTRRLITSQWSNVKMHHEMGERCLLWVRETWYPSAIGDPLYRACKDDGLASLIEFNRQRNFEQWKPSIHMPRWASRLTLEVTSVRIERLQDISSEDCREEGILFGNAIYWPPAAISTYRDLWESLHGEGSWDANPDVVVLKFKVHRENVDALIGQGKAA